MSSSCRFAQIEPIATTPTSAASSDALQTDPETTDELATAEG